MCPPGCSSGERATYLTHFTISSVLSVGASPKIPKFVVSHIPLAQSNSYLSDQISREREKWPLVLMSHGLKGNPEIYTTYGEQLASQGFVVIAPTHTDGSCSESYDHSSESWEQRHRQLNQRVRDMQHILDQLQTSSDPRLSRLAARINSQTVGICGHSFGGATAAQMVEADKRIATGVSLDGWMFPLCSSVNRNSKPFLYINSDSWQWEENLLHMRQWCQNNAAGGHIVTLKGTSHHNYNDLPFYIHPALRRWVSRNLKGWFGAADPEQATRLAVSLTAAFFSSVFGSSTSPDSLRAVIRKCVVENSSKAIVDYVPPNQEWTDRQDASPRTHSAAAAHPSDFVSSK